VRKRNSSNDGRSWSGTRSVSLLRGFSERDRLWAVALHFETTEEAHRKQSVELPVSGVPLAECSEYARFLAVLSLNEVQGFSRKPTAQVIESAVCDIVARMQIVVPETKESSHLFRGHIGE
jgi:hypothetical protein